MDIYGQPYVKLHFSKKAQRLIAQKAMVKGVSIVHQVATDNIFFLVKWSIISDGLV
jgi:hypothetical protein